MAASTKPCTCRQAHAHKRQVGSVEASRVGEHLGCSPCGRLAWVIGVTAWPVPEVLLSLLPERRGLYQFHRFQFFNQRFFARFQSFIALAHLRLGHLRSNRRHLRGQSVYAKAFEHVLEV